MTFRTIFCLLAGLLVSACANAVKPSELPQRRIADVQVTVNPGVNANSDVASKVRQSGLAVAQAYNAYMPANAPAHTVQINIDRIHYKNPLASLLIGDGHYISGVVTGPIPPTSVGYYDAASGVINGVAGAVIAAASNRSAVDTALAKGLANRALAKSFGQSRQPEFVRKHLAGRPSQERPQELIAASASAEPNTGAPSRSTPVERSAQAHGKPQATHAANRRKKTAQINGAPTPPPVNF